MSCLKIYIHLFVCLLFLCAFLNNLHSKVFLSQSDYYRWRARNINNFVYILLEIILAKRGFIGFYNYGDPNQNKHREWRQILSYWVCGYYFLDYFGPKWGHKSWNGVRPRSVIFLVQFKKQDLPFFPLFVDLFSFKIKPKNIFEDTCIICVINGLFSIINNLVSCR